MKLLRLRARYRRWRAERKLKKSGYSSWAMYRHNRDPYVHKYANTVNSFYMRSQPDGYKFVYVIEDQSHYAYKSLYDHGPGGYRYGFHDIGDWCESHCRFRHRVDCHRVLKNNNWWGNGEYELSDIGGGDCLFFAFMDERDYTLFLLRWA